MKNIKARKDKITICLGCISIIIVGYILINVMRVDSQSEKDTKDTPKKTQEFSDTQESEIKKYIDVLRDKDIKENSPEMIFDAIKTLGSIKSKKAIPELINYLDFERKIESTQNQEGSRIVINSWDYLPPSGRYPAIEALFQIGKSSLPALAKVIEEEESGSLKSQNALYTFQFIFLEELPEAIKYLEDALKQSKTENGKKRLQVAIEDTKIKWLKFHNPNPKPNKN